MSYAILDSESKVVEIADDKAKLHSKGILLDSKHLDAKPPQLLADIYERLVGRHSRRSTKTIISELSKYLESGNVKADEKSDLKGPVAKVFQICNSMPDKSRKEVVARCVAEGINAHTARTQYQRWFTMHKHGK